MSTDYTNLQWTLVSEPDENNDAEVKFGCDGTTQKLNIPDVSSVEAVKSFLDTYTVDYCNGKQYEATTTTNHKDLASLVGQTQTAPGPVTPDTTDMTTEG